VKSLFVCLSAVVSTVALGCTGSTSSPPPQNGAPVVPTKGDSKAKTSAPVEKFDTVPLPPKGG